MEIELGQCDFSKMREIETARQCRNSSVEILRFIFMFLIVLLHVYAHGTGLDAARIYTWGKETSTVPHLFLFCLGKVGVTGFMFVSGFYGMRARCHKIAQLILICLFYQIVLTPFGKTACHAYLHPFDGWWFVSVYLFIMVLSPLIEIGISCISRKTFRNIVIAMLGYTYFAQALVNPDARDAVLLLTIYIAARYCKLVIWKSLQIGGGICPCPLRRNIRTFAIHALPDISL